MKGKMYILVILRAVGSGSVQGVSNLHLLDFLDHPGNELVVDRTFHKEST